MKLTFTARGVAILWLRGHAPNSEDEEIASLSDLLEGIWFDGVKAGIVRSEEVVNKSPTMSAAMATLEAEVIDLKRNDKKEDRLRPY